MKGMPARGELLGVLDHAVAPVGRDDAEADIARVRHVVDVRVLHRAGMEGGDLVVVEVGGDEGLRGQLRRRSRAMWSAGMPAALRSTRGTGAKSLPTVAIG